MKLKILFFAFLIILNLSFLCASDVNLKLYANFSGVNTDFETHTDSSATNGYDAYYDAEIFDFPGNYTKLYSTVGGKEFALDYWSSSALSREILLSFDVVPTAGAGYVNFSWDFGGSDDYDALLLYCQDGAVCGDESSRVNLESVSEASYFINAAATVYFKLIINYNPAVVSVDNPTGGGGGGTTPKPSLTLGLPKPISVEEIGPVDFNITLTNDGGVNFNDVNLVGSMFENSIPAKTSVSFSNNSFSSFSIRRSETVAVHSYIDSEEITVYEILINASSKQPSYKTQAKVYLTFIGKNGSGIVKIIAFTEGLINENAECLDLRDMINNAKAEFEQGNTQAAIEKAQEALAACKNILDNPRKPTYTRNNQGFIVLFIAIGLGLAIVLGILLNVYKRVMFSRKRNFN
jgi:hypothetical protein